MIGSLLYFNTCHYAQKPFNIISLPTEPSIESRFLLYNSSYSLLFCPMLYNFVIPTQHPKNINNLFMCSDGPITEFLYTDFNNATSYHLKLVYYKFLICTIRYRCQLKKYISSGAYRVFILEILYKLMCGKDH